MIGGSTASGKSALALALAERIGGVILNADSQQLFADLPILTARPTAAEMARVPHRLFGELAADEQPSVGRWLELVEPVLRDVRAAGRPAILVGGTGLYLHALLHGLPEMPEIPPDLRRELRAWAAQRPAPELHARLATLDPAMAARLRPGDRQRLLRALEVRLGSGRSLREWQATPRRRVPLPLQVAGVALVPPAPMVAARIGARLRAMLEAGAVAQVAALLGRRPDALALPIAKVHGVRELAAVARGELRREAAEAAVAGQVRRYAKRQRTWFRHQLAELRPLALVGESATAIEQLCRLLEEPPLAAT